MASRYIGIKCFGAATLILAAIAIRFTSSPAPIPVIVAHYPPDIPPMNFSDHGGGAGCGDIFLYQQSGDEVLAVNVELSASTSLYRASQARAFAEAEFDLAHGTEGVRVEIQIWDGYPRFCDCLRGNEQQVATWRAKSGQLKITIHGPADSDSCHAECYLASAELDQVIFEDDRGRQVTLKKAKISKIPVGWYAG